MKKIILPVVSALLLWAATAPADSGWLLLYPPTTINHGRGPTYTIEERAALSRWERASVLYVTERHCQMARLSLIARREDYFLKVAPFGPGDAAQVIEVLELAGHLLQRTSASQCVSADDPRLAGGSSGPEVAPPAKAEPKVTPAPPARGGRDALADSFFNQGIIRYTPGRPIIAVVVLNGRTTARLILDTGADGSMVKPALLAAAGVDMSRPAARGKATGVTGKVEVSYFAVDFEVAGHRARVPRVAAFNTYEDGFADGLLGRDFLDRFKVVMDPAAGTVTLVPR